MGFLGERDEMVRLGKPIFIFFFNKISDFKKKNEIKITIRYVLYMILFSVDQWR